MYFSGIKQVPSLSFKDILCLKGKKIDTSKVPKLKEEDLEEKFIKGLNWNRIETYSLCLYCLHKADTRIVNL